MKYDITQLGTIIQYDWQRNTSLHLYLRVAWIESAGCLYRDASSTR